jgi:hypothetical protein
MTRIRIAALLAALALVPAIAEAQTTITACYVPKTGSVYRIEAAGAPQACKNGHVKFSWEAGASLPVAPQAVMTTDILQPGEDAFVTAACPAGTRAFSGAFRIIPPATDVVFLLSAPSEVPVGWTIRARNEGAIPAEVAAHAYCVAYAP